MTKDKMVRWHHRLNGHEFERSPRYSKGRGSLVCCSPWSHKESDTTENLTELDSYYGNCKKNVVSHFWLFHSPLNKVLCVIIYS